MRYQNPLEYTLGLGGALAKFIIDSEPARDTPPRMVVEVGERFLHGIPGLEVTHFRIGVNRGNAGGLFSSTFLSSPVGYEYHIALEPFFHAGALGLGADVNLYTLSLGAFANTHLATLGAQVGAQLSESMFLGYTIENVRVHGEFLPGADTSLFLIASPRATLGGAARLRLTRDGTVDASIGSWVWLGRALAVAMGYEDASGTMKAAAALSVGAFAISLGASLHPVLGVSKSVFLAWRR
jgi:hypothetical protein